jgi:hypothetical protein
MTFAQSQPISMTSSLRNTALTWCYSSSGSKKKLGIIIEVQLDCDYKKKYAWPAYIANLRRRHRCPVCLLIITVEKAVAHWAGKVICLGPGTRCRPYVIGPSNAPVISSSQQAQDNFELAVLSAFGNCRNADRQLAKQIVSTVLEAGNHVEPERAVLYLDELLRFIEDNAPDLLEDNVKNSLGFEYQSNFARRYVAQGLAEGEAKGRVEGQRELVLKQLQHRFGPLSDLVLTHVRDAQESQLEEIALRIHTVQSPEQLFGSLE